MLLRGSRHSVRLDNDGTNKQLRRVSAALSKKVSRLDGRITDLELELLEESKD